MCEARIVFGEATQRCGMHAGLLCTLAPAQVQLHRANESTGDLSMSKNLTCFSRCMLDGMLAEPRLVSEGGAMAPEQRHSVPEGVPLSKPVHVPIGKPYIWCATPKACS
jgi:hypothetical protein